MNNSSSLTPAEQKANVKTLLASNAYAIRPSEEGNEMILTDQSTGENYTLSVELLQELVNDPFIPEHSLLRQAVSHSRRNPLIAPPQKGTMLLEIDTASKEGAKNKSLEIKIPVGSSLPGRLALASAEFGGSPAKVSSPMVAGKQSKRLSLRSSSSPASNQNSKPSPSPRPTISREEEKGSGPNRYNPQSVQKPNSKKKQNNPSRYRPPAQKHGKSMLSSKNLLKVATAGGVATGGMISGNAAVSLILNNSSGEETAALFRQAINHVFSFFV